MERVNLVRRCLIVLLALAIVWTAGCRISRNIVDVAPAVDVPPLQDLERHLDYQDPDAGRPDYVRLN